MSETTQMEVLEFLSENFTSATKDAYGISIDGTDDDCEMIITMPDGSEWLIRPELLSEEGNEMAA